MKRPISIIIILFMIAGCVSGFTEIRKSDLSQAFIINSSPTFQGYYYLGTDESFHYFTGKWEYGADRQFKIRKDDLAVSIEKPYGKTEIIIYEFKPTGFEVESFCMIWDQDLFIRK